MCLGLKNELELLLIEGNSLPLHLAQVIQHFKSSLLAYIISISKSAIHLKITAFKINVSPLPALKFLSSVFNCFAIRLVGILCQIWKILLCLC